MNDQIFEIIYVMLEYVNLFFLLYLAGYSTFLFLSVVVGSSTLYHKRRQEKLKNSIMEDYYVPVTIIVPAYNEEVTVTETVRSLLQLQYRAYEIIIVDDGSKDATSQTLIDAFNMHIVAKPIRRQVPCQQVEFIYETYEEKVPVTLIRKKNGGKADALNMGINASNYPYFICMDADSVPQYDSLQKIVAKVLENDNVVAAGGSIRACNNVILKNGRVESYKLPENLLACMQVLEYDRSFLASRILFDYFKGSMIISGAFGLFKKDIVIACGGYERETMGEDMELVLRLHDFCLINNIPYDVKYATDAICWTQAPEKLGDLCRQRKRWHLGLFQCMWKHKKMFMNPRYKTVGMISYLYFLMYELLSPFIEIFGIITMILAYAADLLNLKYMIMFLGVYVIFSSILSLTAFFARIQTIDLTLSVKDMLKAVFLCAFEIAGLRFVMAFVRFTAFFGYKKKRKQWGSIERKKIDLQ